jgi:hypothetical protein
MTIRSLFASNFKNDHAIFRCHHEKDIDISNRIDGRAVVDLR